ncbi:MAG: hypothetical protein GC162_04175 [Planctomycetes bacterium]|nr:hypothetical protein [Planctomycetota bacterium]
MATLTARLSRFFHRARPRKPVAIDIFKSAERSPERLVDSLAKLADPPVIKATAERREPVNGNGSNGNGDHRPRGFFSLLPGAKRDAAIVDLQKGYMEVVDLMKTVREHLSTQSQRSARLLELMQHLPEALQSLPEHSRNQARMLEVMQMQVEQQNRHASHFAQSISALTRVSEQHTQIMGCIQQHMDAATQNDAQLLGSFSAMNHTLEDLSESTRASSAALRSVTEQAQSAEQRMQQLMERQSRQMTVLSITSWIMAAIALGVAVYAVARLS